MTETDNPIASAVAAEAPVRRGRSRRGLRGSRAGLASGMKWLWIALGTLVMLIIAGWLGLNMWIKSYMQSEKFRRWVSAELSNRVDAEVQIDGVQWQDSSAFVPKAEATGRPDSAFAKVEVHDIRTVVNTGAIWDRLIQVESIKVARVSLDFSSDTPRASAETYDPSAAAAPGSSNPSFFSRFLPNRTVVKGVTVDQFGLLWKNPARSVEARNISLDVKPADDNSFFLATGTGGTLDVSMLPGENVKLRNFSATLQSGEVSLDEFSADSVGADITAEGSLTLSQPPALYLKVGIKKLDLARLVPEDWIKRLHGKASGDLKISGDPSDFSRLLWVGKAGIEEGVVEGLPVLAILARKTQKEAFMRIALKEAKAAFMRSPEGSWRIENLLLDSPGLLRLKGRVAIGADESLRGELLLGIVPGTFQYVAGAEQEVFLPLDKLLVTSEERKLITSDDAALRWTRLTLSGTLDDPKEDLADRLAKAWFNATVDEVLKMTPEAALKAAEAVGKVASEAAATVVERAPDLIDAGAEAVKQGVETGGGLLQKGVEGGLKAIEDLLPK